MATSWLDEIRTQAWDVWVAFRDEVGTQGLLPMLEPVAPFNRPQFLAPAVAIGGLLSMILLSGLALTALGTFLLALLALWVLLVDVFGVSIELAPLGAVR
ncbi:MAG: hypothetical protein U0807_07465 [Candidatus Binatia bacterium]